MKFKLEWVGDFIVVVGLFFLIISCGGNSIENSDIFDPSDIDNNNTDPDSGKTSPAIKIIKVENPALTAAQGNVVFKLYKKRNADGTSGPPQLYRSTDRGDNFENIPVPEEIDSISSWDSIYLSPNNTFLWAHALSIFSDHIIIYRSIDLGETFTVIEVAWPKNAEDSLIQESYYLKSSVPRYSLSGEGLAWIGGQNGTPLYLLAMSNHNIDFLKSTDDGLNFSTSSPIGYLDSFMDIRASAYEEKFFLLRENWDLYISNDGVQTFASTVKPTEKYYLPVIDVAVEKQNVYLIGLEMGLKVGSEENDIGLYNCYLFKSTDVGQTFSEPNVIAAFSGGDARWNIDDIMVQGENIYVLFSGGGMEGYASALPLHVITSQDGGATFTESQRISDIEPIQQWSSSIMDEPGNLFIFWTDGEFLSYW